METDEFFTTKEKDLLFSLYRKLLQLSGETLQKGDCKKLKTHLVNTIQNNRIQRDIFGLNPVIKDMQTAVIVAEEIGMTEEEIRNQPHISFRLVHHLFHIHHHGKIIIRGKTAYTFLVYRSPVQHIPVLHSIHISGKTLCIGRQQQSSFIEAGVGVKRGFRNARQLCQYCIPG